MAWLKSIKKFLKTPACGCKKKTLKRSSGKRSSGKRKFRGGYQTIDGVTVNTPHSKSKTRSRSKSGSRKSI